MSYALYPDLGALIEDANTAPSRSRHATHDDVDRGPLDRNQRGRIGDQNPLDRGRSPNDADRTISGSQASKTSHSDVIREGSRNSERVGDRSGVRGDGYSGDISTGRNESALPFGFRNYAEVARAALWLFAAMLFGLSATLVALAPDRDGFEAGRSEFTSQALADFQP